MRLVKLFFILGFFVSGYLKAQLAGDAFSVSTDENFKGRHELRKISRNFKKVRKRESFISRKYGARAAQRFIKKKRKRLPHVKRERWVRIS
ncbi:MAG: hypothetical protein ACK5AY_07630 [Bacteroidota bacterium]|jgi:hypothetical protein